MTTIETEWDRTVTIEHPGPGRAVIEVRRPTTGDVLRADLDREQTRRLAEALKPEQAEQATGPLAPEHCDPDTWYEITHYMQRVVAKRDNEDPKYPWRISLSHRCSDRVVKDPVPLAPAGEAVIPPARPADENQGVSDAVDADLFGIEAEAAVDPVEDLATRFKAAARDALRTTVDAMTAIAPALAAFDFDELVNDISPEQWRTMARNVLRREADQ